MLVVQEMEVAKTGKGIEEEGGAVFDVTEFQLDYLTTPSGLLDIGIDLTKVDITTRTRPADELYIIAYPHFNVNGKSAAKCSIPLEQADSPQMHFKAHDIAVKHLDVSKQSVPYASYVSIAKATSLIPIRVEPGGTQPFMSQPQQVACVVRACLYGTFSHNFANALAHTHISPATLVTLGTSPIHLHVAFLVNCAQSLASAET